MNTPSLDVLFPAHIAELRSRTDRALAAAGFDGVVFQSGEPLGLARDDQHPRPQARPMMLAVDISSSSSANDTLPDTE